MNCGKFQIYSSVVLTIVACSLGGCSRAVEPPDLTRITPGWQIVDDRGVIYKADKNQFLWGIVFPPREGLGSCYLSPTKSTVNSRSFALQLVDDTLTVTNGTKSVTIKIRPHSVNLLNADLTIKSSKDISGIQFIPRKEWSRDANGYVTLYDLEFPQNFYDRFEDQKQ